MSVRLLPWFVFLLAFLLSSLSQAAPLPVPAPPELDAKSYILMDFDSGEILAEKNPDNPVEPASITKMMTAYIIYSELEAGHISLDEEVTISEKAWRMQGSRMFVEAGKKVAVSDLLKGMIIQSGNDATVALAEHVAGTESAFVDMMNATAQALGMHQTQ
jgi:serine-type D-Ala-D-Ala carboxypeptidase (penicillin-binding protein 5/6)